MMKTKLYYMTWLFAALFAISCEDLEDTYDEFAGDGMIRYVGKCQDLSVKPGWKRLCVIWKGNLDPHIEKVKITYQSELDAEPMVKYVKPKDVLESDLMDTTYLEGLQDAVYAVKVSNVAADSTESIVQTEYGRPYTETHEDLRSFTRGIVNFYPIGDKMVVTLDRSNSNLKEINLKYWGTDKKEHTWNILQNMDRLVNYMLEDIMFMLPDEDSNVAQGVKIDFGKPLTIERRGLLTGCIDTIRFNPDTLLLEEQVWSSDFVNLMMHKYGADWRSKVDEIKELEIDYTMSTFQDLLYFPKLKKVILGKNRYMLTDHQENISTTDPYLALVTLYYLNKMQGVEVEVYNEPYLFGGINIPYVFEGSYIDLLTQDLMGTGVPVKIDNMNWLTKKGSANLNQMPQITPLNTEGWELTCSDTTYNGSKPGGVARMLDDEPSTVFEPGVEFELSVITVNIDMKESQPLHGFKLVQANMGTGYCIGQG